MAMAAAPSPFAVFKRRNFALMWTGQLVETIGASLTSLAAGILVYRITGGSALSVGLMLMASAAPSLVFGLFAGVIVDRYDRKRIMIAADVLRAVLVLLLPFLAPFGIVWLYIVVLLISSVGQFFDPAYEAILAEAAPDEELGAANSLIAIASFGSTAIGFAASGLIAARYPIEYAFYLNAAAYLFSALCISLLRVKKLEVEGETSAAVILSNLKFGLNYMVNSPVLRSLFYIAIPVAITFGLANSLLLPMATRALGATEFEYGIQEGLTSVGFVVASLLMASILNRWREGQWMVVGLIGMGLAGVAYSQMSGIWIAIAIQMFSGFMNAPYAIARRLLVQRNTVPEVRGRVASSYFFASNIFFLVGMAAAGLADIMDVRLLYLVGSILTVGIGVWALVLPGVGQPAAEWRKALRLLRSTPATVGLEAGRAVLPSDVDLLVGLVPTLSGLSRQERDRLITQGRVIEVSPQTAILRKGDKSDFAYFVLEGKAVAGIDRGEGNYQILNPLEKGDFFGEIAALTGAVRTADVVSEESMRLLEIPAANLRALMALPDFSQLVLEKMSERLARASIRDLPRFAGIDQQAARELREAPLPETATTQEALAVE